MKDKTIIKKAVEKAVKNGWNLILDGIRAEWLDADFEGMTKEPLAFRGIFFDPEFAKNFWPGETVALKDHWTCHQHNMLDMIQRGENPIKYLEKFL